MPHIITGRSKFKDKSGERVYFQKPYFDKAFRRGFRSAEEKANFMNSHNIVQNGDSDEKATRERNQLQAQERERSNQCRK